MERAVLGKDARAGGCAAWPPRHHHQAFARKVWNEAQTDRGENQTMDRKINPLKARSKFKARLLFGMVLKPLRLFCQHCDKYMPSDMEWRCAYCGHHNEGTKIYSFLN